MKITSPYFLALMAVVLYSISMLIYATLSIFKNADPNNISAFGSILGGVGAIFSGLIALTIFYGWKKQHNKSIVSNEAKLAFNKIHNERNIIHSMKFNLNKIYEIYDSERIAYIHTFLSDVKKLEELHNNNKGAISEFINLIEGSKLQRDILEYSSYLENFQNIRFRDLGVDQTVFIHLMNTISKSENLNSDVLQELKTYIFA
ncbi:hypothetical protein ACNPQK_22725 [Acinetobacter guillouiae]